MDDEHLHQQHHQTEVGDYHSIYIFNEFLSFIFIRLI